MCKKKTHNEKGRHALFTTILNCSDVFSFLYVFCECMPVSTHTLNPRQNQDSSTTRVSIRNPPFSPHPQPFLNLLVCVCIHLQASRNKPNIRSCTSGGVIILYLSSWAWHNLEIHQWPSRILLDVYLQLLHEEVGFSLPSHHLLQNRMQLGQSKQLRTSSDIQQVIVESSNDSFRVLPDQIFFYQLFSLPFLGKYIYFYMPRCPVINFDGARGHHHHCFGPPFYSLQSTNLRHLPWRRSQFRQTTETINLPGCRDSTSVKRTSPFVLHQCLITSALCT